ncbi:MAG: hypothetical protein K2O66_02325, partial [Bacteroidales bacterium]|nr:hypothetical protein [Bacteroidales bacterium]
FFLPKMYHGDGESDKQDIAQPEKPHAMGKEIPAYPAAVIEVKYQYGHAGENDIAYVKTLETRHFRMEDQPRPQKEKKPYGRMDAKVDPAIFFFIHDTCKTKKICGYS